MTSPASNTPRVPGRAAPGAGRASSPRPASLLTGMTVCSGIGAPETAAPWIDWRYASEIEPFPCAVMRERHPLAHNLGDMTKWEEWPDADVDVLVGGTPCQSFSVAGLRQGLADPRGNLMLTFGAIAGRYRPEWLVWENVPGVLSSNGGRDFGTFLGMLAELGYGFAYRVLDAQHFGVAQRRRRVFVVAHSGDWRRAAAVLFERESLSGHPAPRREAGEGIAPTISARPTGGGGLGTDFDCDGGLIASHDPACTLTARDRKGPLPEADLSTVVAHALRGEGFDASEDGTGRSTQIVPVSLHGAQDPIHTVDVAQAVGRNNGLENCVAFDPMQITSKTNRSNPQPGDPCHTLPAQSTPPHIAHPWAVRRLTPRECERLQGFPDDYTAIPWRGKPAENCPDGPRYKALGNSMAVPVMRWILQRVTDNHALAQSSEVA